ncbi:MAG: hypothetical protein ACQEXQ_16090 [Bacillota bacterium]
MIEQIKDALSKVHKDGWSNFNDVSCEDYAFVAEYDALRETQGGLIATCETVEDATFIANTPTYIRYLLDELEKAKIALYTHESYDRTVSEMHIENEQLRTEHTAMKEALEFYAAESTYDIDHLSKHGFMIIDRDDGEKARNALSTLKKEGPTE